MDILDDDTIAVPSRVQVISAAGKLPPWMQNNCRASPSSTEVELGLTRKVLRMTESKKKCTITKYMAV